MEKLFMDLVEQAKKDKSKLIVLKEATIKCQNFELAANLRDLETKYFPETEEEKTAKHEGSKLNTLFRLVELNIPNDVAWLINATVKRYRRRRDNFDMKDAAELMAKKEKLFSKE